MAGVSGMERPGRVEERSPPVGGSLLLEEEAADQVSEAEEHEDHERDDRRDREDHRQDGGTFVAHSIEPRLPRGRSRSAIR